MTAPHDSAAFSTGLVAELYAPLRRSTPDPAIYERFVRSAGEPALELGCGAGDPLLALRQRGLQVEGLDSSADMLQRARRAAEQCGVSVTLHLGDIRDRISCTTVSVARNEATRTQVTRLRYVRDGPSGRTEVERDWLTHWYSPAQFAALASQAGFTVRRCSEWDGRPATDSSTGFAVTLVPSAPSAPSAC